MLVYLSVKGMSPGNWGNSTPDNDAHGKKGISFHVEFQVCNGYKV